MFYRPQTTLRPLALIAFLVIAALGFILTLRVTHADSAPPAQRYAARFAPGLTASSPASGTLAASSQATMQGWICLEALTSGHVFSNQTSYGFQVDSSGRIVFFDGITVTAPSALPLRTWTHIAATFNSGSIILYVNGQQVATGTAASTLPASNQLIFSGTTGESGGFSSGGFRGALAQVSTWNRALSQSEIQTFSSQYLQGSESGLTAYYPFDRIELFKARDAGPSNLGLQLGTREYGSDSAEPKFADFTSVTSGPYFQNETVANPGFALRGNEGRLIDVTGDGKPEVIANRFDGDSSVPMFAMQNNGNGGFSNATTAILGNSPPQTEHERDYAVADFNGDGRKDVFVADHGPESGPDAFVGGFSKLLIQTADGRLVDETASRMPVHRMFTHGVAAGEIDSDGDVDLFLNNGVNPRLLINDGTGHFTENTSRLPASFVSGPSNESSRFIDVDKDSDLDLVLGAAWYSGKDRDTILINDGSGNFSFAPTTAMPLRGGGMTASVSIASADFDGDTWPDLIMANHRDYLEPRVQLLLNNHDGTFRDATPRIEQSSWPSSETAGGGLYWIIWLNVVDFNNDGLPDFMTTAGRLQSRLFMNIGNGQFVEETGILPADMPQNGGSDLFGDVDGDSDTDIFKMDYNQFGFALERNLNPYNPNSGCTFSLSPSGAQNFTAAGGPGSFSIIASGNGCQSLVSTDASWISFSGERGGSGSRTINFTIASNSGAARGTTILAGGQTITINQAPSSCTYSLSPTSQSFAGAGGTSTVSVTTQGGCDWTATSNDSWITVNSGTPGTGNGSVGYTVGNNTAALRTGTMTIAGQTFTVTQAASGSSAYFNLEPFAVQSEVDAGRLIDFDSDGDLDLILVQAAANWAPRAMLAYRNDGQGHYSDVTNTEITTSVTTEAPGEAKLWAADFNNDGKMDIFIPDGGPDTSPYPGGQSRILVQSNDGHLVDETATRLPQIRSFAHSAAVADIDGDGDLDIFIGNVNNNIGNGLPAVGPRFYINDGTGHFTSRIDNLPAWVATVVYPNPQFSGSLLIDVNNDNFPDLVLGPQRIQGGVIDTTRDIVLLNDGHGDFQTVAPSTSMPLRANGPDGLSLQFTSADFNGDGLADILYTSQSGTSDAGNKLILYLNNGNATFFDASDRIPQGSGLCYHSEPVDINSDNRMDFVCRSSPGQIPRLFVNMGQAQFIEQTSLIGNSVPYGRIYGGDVDGDGDKDLVMTAPNQSAVARNLQPILINQGCGVSLSPPSQSFGSAGGTGSVGLTAGAGCNWMASSDADWIHVTSSPSTGTGNTTVNFSVDANNGAARSSKLIIGGQNFTITQSGVSTFTVSGHVSTVNGPLAGVSVYLNVNNVSTRLATTDANGLYQFTQVSAGTYTITAAKDGYLFDSPTVTVSNADQTNVDVHAASNVFGQPPAQDYFLDFSPSANNDQRAAIAPQSALLNLTSEFSMEVWIYRKGAAPFCDIMGKTAVNPGDPFRSYSLTFDDTGTKIAFVQTTGQSGSYRAAGSSTPLQLNTWTHVAGTLKNGTLRLYINGVEVAFNSSAGPSNNSTNPFSLGGGVRNGMVAEATLPSRLRQARVWSRALTPFDLYYNSSRNLGGNESGLIAYWKLDEGQGQIAHDSTANHLDLQLGVTPNVDANDPQWVDVNGCGYSLSPGSQTFGAGGGNSTVNVTSPNGCNWTAASNDSWITINSGASGSGNGSVGYSVAANSGASRTGTMTIAGQTFTVNQSGSPGVVQLSSATYSVNEGAGSLVVTVNRTNGTSGSVSVGYFTGGGNASVGADYTFTGGTLTFGDGETSKTFSIPINEDNAVEGNETFSVTLNNPNGGVGIGAISTAIVTIVDNDSCAFSLNPSSQSFTSGGGTGIVNVTTNPGCSASATSNDSWITVTSVGTDSNGSGEVRYSVAANPNSNPRTGTINISGQSYTVNEGGISCAFSLNPTGESIGPSGGNISVSVMAAASDCNWTAINNNPEFLTITSGTSGTGNGTVTLSVAPNTGSTSRTGTLTLAGQPFTVTQAASAMTVQFSASTASATETANATTNVDLVVTRTGDTTAPATVNYASSDGTASERSDYLAALGTLHFAAGETSKTITVFIVDDAFGEGPETFSVTLSNPVGCTLGSPSVLTVTINSDESANGPNPVRDASFNTDFFVRQHYIDFFNREADAPGLAFWKNQIDECTTQACRDIRKINVSAAFFLSIEFQQTGYLVYKANQASFNSGEFLKLRDFLPDTQEIGRGVVIGQPGADAQLEANKQKFFLDFVQRSKFLDPAAYPTTMTAAQFVDKLNANTFDPRNTGSGGALSSSERDALVSQLSANPSSPALRAQVLRSVGENSLFNNRQFNKAFVLMQYFGYLRRNPNDPPEAGLDFGGYNFWLGKLNQFNGNFVNAEMVKAFIVSGEYQGRFGP